MHALNSRGAQTLASKHKLQGVEKSAMAMSVEDRCTLDTKKTIKRYGYFKLEIVEVLLREA